jgi:hypothetical protein
VRLSRVVESVKVAHSAVKEEEEEEEEEEERAPDIHVKRDLEIFCILHQ